eukprot:TRINITY_DN7280_c0_g2_i1.p1 TRINITY_DN7280_c0_g2~~TRINITY_DN7280_c0_g2_i1.p1  ORF type:complete len:101 (+),score=6.05 TRINITY_DN7280_c0_g2_i1:81-383(+)
MEKNQTSPSPAAQRVHAESRRGEMFPHVFSAYLPHSHYNLLTQSKKAILLRNCRCSWGNILCAESESLFVLGKRSWIDDRALGNLCGDTSFIASSRGPPP